MTKIINFEKMRMRNLLKKHTSNNSELLESEILLSVIRFIYNHSEVVENPFDEIQPNASLHKLLSGNSARFAAVFVDLVKYWEIGPLNKSEIPYDSEFKEFETVEHLCIYVHEKLINK